MEIKKFYDYKKQMTDEEIEAFAHYGFICKQVLGNIFKELKK